MEDGSGILSLAPWAAPTITALAVLVQNVSNRRSIIKRLDEVERQQLVLIMHDALRPWSARLDAGKKYLDLGGNGSEAAYYEKLKERFQERVQQKMMGEQMV